VLGNTGSGTAAIKKKKKIMIKKKEMCIQQENAGTMNG
jgi:hypothetical protein